MYLCFEYIMYCDCQNVIKKVSALPVHNSQIIDISYLSKNIFEINRVIIWSKSITDSVK